MAYIQGDHAGPGQAAATIIELPSTLYRQATPPRPRRIPGHKGVEGNEVTYQTPVSDTTTSRTRKISHPGVRALTKQPSPRPPQSPSNRQLKPHTLNIIIGRIKIQEVKENDREARIQQAIQEGSNWFRTMEDLHSVSSG